MKPSKPIPRKNLIALLVLLIFTLLILISSYYLHIYQEENRTDKGGKPITDEEKFEILSTIFEAVEKEGIYAEITTGNQLPVHINTYSEESYINIHLALKDIFNRNTRYIRYRAADSDRSTYNGYLYEVPTGFVPSSSIQETVETIVVEIKHHFNGNITPVAYPEADGTERIKLVVSVPDGIYYENGRYDNSFLNAWKLREKYEEITIIEVIPLVDK